MCGGRAIDTTTAATQVAGPRREHIGEGQPVAREEPRSSKRCDAAERGGRLSGRHPAAFATVCAQLDRTAEARRGYTLSMEELGRLCATAVPAGPDAPEQQQQQREQQLVQEMGGPLAVVPPLVMQRESAPDSRFDLRGGPLEVCFISFDFV
jgi:hypothetical protein